MANIVVGTELLNSGLTGGTSLLGAQWQVLKQAGVDDAAAWDAIRNYCVLEEQANIRRLKNERPPSSDIEHYTNWGGKQKLAIAAREERLEKLLNLRNPHRMEVAA